MTNKARKPYQKPQIRRVKLVVEEAVLGACKRSPLDMGPTGNLYHCYESPCLNTYGT